MANLLLEFLYLVVHLLEIGFQGGAAVACPMIELLHLLIEEYGVSLADLFKNGIAPLLDLGGEPFPAVAGSSRTVRRISARTVSRWGQSRDTLDLIRADSLSA